MREGDVCANPPSPWTGARMADAAYEQVRAERDRYRAALVAIEQMLDLVWNEDHEAAANAAFDTARAALNAKPTEEADRG